MRRVCIGILTALAGPAVLLCLLPPTVSFARVATGRAPGRVPSAEIEQRVIASLPARHGASAHIVYHLDLTRLFDTRTRWTFVIATLPGSHFSASSGKMVDGGPLAQCFVNGLAPHCSYAMPHNASRLSWFAIPLHFYSARAVFAGANHSRPLLLIRTAAAYAGDGSHGIFTRLFRYDRRKNRFDTVFSNSTGSNNNQETRFIGHGPLRGDIIVAVPTATAPYAFWVSVYVRGKDGQYSDRALRYRSATRYGDGNPLSVIDSEMPNILERLGKRHPGDALPIPRRLPSGCTPHFFIRHGEEWCIPG